MILVVVLISILIPIAYTNNVYIQDNPNPKPVWNKATQHPVKTTYQVQNTYKINSAYHGHFSHICPEGDALKPCYCHKNFVVCDGEQEFELPTIVQTLSETANSSKFLWRFDIMSNKMTELSENTFKDLNIWFIWLMGAENLKTIHSDAFIGTNNVTRNLEISYCPLLDTTNLFEVLNKFEKLQFLVLKEINLQSIPANAFTALKHLKTIHISDSKLVTIGEKAFYLLPVLQMFTISQTSMTRIPKDVLVFSNDYDIKTTVKLLENPLLKSESFEVDSLAHMGRPTILHLQAINKNPYQWKYLLESAFKPFLLENRENVVVLIGHGGYVVPDKRNEWLQSNKKLLKKVVRFGALNMK